MDRAGFRVNQAQSLLATLVDMLIQVGTKAEDGNIYLTLPLIRSCDLGGSIGSLLDRDIEMMLAAWAAVDLIDLHSENQYVIKPEHWKNLQRHDPVKGKYHQ